MAKFGDLISAEVPVLFYFFKSTLDSEENKQALTQVASNFGVKAKVIKIDIDKNIDLSEALKVKSSPTYIIYQDEEMKWRTTEALSHQKLIEVLNEFIS